MTDLRKLARGRECLVRLPDVCNGNPETTVLAHFRLAGLSGMGIKSPDLFAAFACSACHDAIDRRAHMDLDRDYVRLAHLEGVLRTQRVLLNLGIIHIGNAALAGGNGDEHHG